MKPQIKLTIDETERYGNCAVKALSLAFDIKPLALEMILELMGVEEPKKGLTFYECKRFINYYAKTQYVLGTIKYIPNYYKIRYAQLVTGNMDRSILSHFDGHMSYCSNGEIFDSYFSKNDVLKVKPTGWWIIK